ncbi:very long-chain acyl-coa synthetase-like [Plakobranchus ocellatus]|uniref:long-chain-fatty-acid--CoA ligase n=1 Tax=Plakobranchus ocellatus TaxID=259542 RepID=A0AAV3XXY4_9GAST|nr:very long-chain acyl-coa synthetase-like [Plakobranchus ocellatus]
MFLTIIAATAVAITLASLMVVALLYPGIYRDVYTIIVFMRIVRLVKRSCTKPKFIIDRFEEVVAQHPDKIFLVFHKKRFSYATVDSQANRVARVLTSLGFRAGDTLALIMSNEPAFIWIYLGVQKIGGRIALVNHHLMAEGLRHSIVSCAPKMVLVGDGLDEYLPARVEALEPALDIPVYTYNPMSPTADTKKGSPASGLPCFSTLMVNTSADAVSPRLRAEVRLSDPGAFIFTSGTTGLPKPAIITQKKMIVTSHSYSPVGFSSNEILYLTLPLYHASALNLALLNVISAGATIVLREKFSVSQFWHDCVEHDVTCFQYIGEMLRYLVNSPRVPEEKQHKVWAVVGNGLRADIWDEFKKRFQVDHIYEFYGATEVPATMINLFNVPGSVGRLSPLLSRLMNLILVKIDDESGELYRNAEGKCQPIQPGSNGVMLLKLSSKVQFDGYLGPAADTRKRIVNDVLEDGDFYVNTNDVFFLDGNYNLFFKDRVGDSFRWKGENVSTAEVSNVMNTASFIQDTNVYGVKVQGCEGRAGMAAVNLKSNEEVDTEKLEELSKICRTKLPGYARPRFLRFQRQMSLTSTFKQQKTDLLREGYDPQVVQEPLFYLDRAKDEFKELDETAYKKITLGEIAL